MGFLLDQNIVLALAAASGTGWIFIPRLGRNRAGNGGRGGGKGK